jgi:uncharacterized membrane protein YtjA (UPF0391 family)
MGLLGWALIFLTVAGAAAILGFGGAATAAAGPAKLLFFVFLAIFAALLIVGILGAGAAAA